MLYRERNVQSQFRCVYCLCRERWFPDGDDSFSVDHVQPQSVAQHLASQYDNLVYACWRCNSAKQDLLLTLDPAKDVFAEHLKIHVR
jgi:5-methylcytosine-specific restriction endonuclease McrA